MECPGGGRGSADQCGEAARAQHVTAPTATTVRDFGMRILH
jgi:hypothetical protein